MSEWISVKDRLPVQDRPWRYLVVCVDPYFGTTVVDTMRYAGGVWYYDGVPTDATVTHWMPLPEPPKEEEDGVAE